MPFNDQSPPFSSPESSPPPEPEKEWVRRTCPKVTPSKSPSWVSKKETVGGRCDYIGPDNNLCPHWRARDSYACPCHIEAYEGPNSTAGMRIKRTKKKRKIVANITPDPSMWSKKEPL